MHATGLSQFYLASLRGAMSQKETLPGIYRAIVEDNNDPHGSRRVKIRLSQSDVTGWAEPVIWPKTLPPIGGAIWVMFEAGDAHRPVYFYQ